MLKNVKIVTLASLALLGAGLCPAWAATGDHGLPGEFLTYDVGARAAGMGGAMAGLADDVSAAFYNPAGLAKQNPVQFGLQHVILFSDTMFDFLGFSMPIQEFGTIGLGAVLLKSANFDVRDEHFQPGTVANSISQGGVVASYARDLMSDLAVGANVKVAYENDFGHTGTGVGVDLGAMYTLLPELQVGLFLNNVLAPKVMSDTYAGYATLGIGGKLFNDALLLDADVIKSFYNQGIKWKLGGQVDVYETMAFARAGLDDEMRVTLGAGGKYMNATLDYAIGLEPLGLSHKISLGYSFGGYECRITVSPKIFSPVGIKKEATYAIVATSKYPIRNWELNIKDQNGDVIKSYSGEDNPPNQVVWNGKDDRGLPAPDGNFTAQLCITDSNGKTTKSNVETVGIQSAVPLGDEGTGLELQ